MSIKKKEVIPFLVKQLSAQKFKNICAKDGKHPLPKPIFWEKGDAPNFPDLTAEKDKAIGIFSIVEDPDSISKGQLKKFQLFSAFTEQRKGKHFLVTDSSNADELANFCESHSLNAEFLLIERRKSG